MKFHMSALTMSNCNKKAENRVPCNISREENDQAMNIFHQFMDEFCQDSYSDESDEEQANIENVL